MNVNRLILLLIFTVSLVLLSCETEAPEESETELVRTVNVELLELEPEDFASYLRLVGTVTTSQDVRISAEVSGRVLEFYKREGDSVRKGGQILKIDDQKLRQEVRRLRAVTEQSRENYERLQRLYETDDIGSEIEVLNARYTYEQNQASLESMEVDLENTSIKAPFNGEIEEILVETGERVSPGTPVLRLISRSGMKITVGIPGRYSGDVDRGDEAEVWFDFAPENRLNLPISFVGSTIDPLNRTFKADLELPDDVVNAKIDMLANVRLRTHHIPEVIVVGEEFIFRRDDHYVAYVAGENEEGQPVAVERSLDLGPTYGNRVVVNEGLNAGDRLITLGSSYLQDGTRISPSGNSSGQVATRSD
ncbi:MAG: efflux RND transporter periplasmic adaptor subunit [Balneolaceae bacterium]